ncbi:MAG: hypothetical protein P1U56_21945 [Saprospiraceae bacterium]|nr:hypothetical protein [Saprospiraceae bacterium]
MKILRRITMCILMLISGFLIGVLIAYVMEAGKGQMLAGGAIVFGYGIGGSLMSLLVFSLLVFLKNTSAKTEKWINVFLCITIVLISIFFWNNHQNRQKIKNESIGYYQAKDQLLKNNQHNENGILGRIVC